MSNYNLGYNNNEIADIKSDKDSQPRVYISTPGGYASNLQWLCRMADFNEQC